MVAPCCSSSLRVVEKRHRVFRSLIWATLGVRVGMSNAIAMDQRLQPARLCDLPLRSQIPCDGNQWTFALMAVAHTSSTLSALWLVRAEYYADSRATADGVAILAAAGQPSIQGEWPGQRYSSTVRQPMMAPWHLLPPPQGMAARRSRRPRQCTAPPAAAWRQSQRRRSARASSLRRRQRRSHCGRRLAAAQARPPYSATGAGRRAPPRAAFAPCAGSGCSDEDDEASVGNVRARAWFGSPAITPSSTSWPCPGGCLVASSVTSVKFYMPSRIT